MNLPVDKKDVPPVIYFSLSFRKLCLTTVSLPLITLFVCFVTAYIFQYDDVHETHCKVYNVIPSISAITGVSPQRYLWRMCIALHIGPRFIIVFVYRSYYRSLLASQTDPQVLTKANFWLDVSFWLNIIELSSLCGVTYISNRENYPVHEKIFIVFMTSSLSYMLACIKAVRLARYSTNEDLSTPGLYAKQIIFAVSMISTVGLVVFFLKHRLLCHDLAFTWFALCEYIIASANMAFHMTIVLDFPTEHLMVGNGLTVNNHRQLGWKLD